MKLIETTNAFCKEISKSIYEHVKNGDFCFTSDDDWFVEELSTRIEMVQCPSNFFWLSFDLPEELVALTEDVEEITTTVAVFRDVDAFSISADNAPLDGSPVGLHLNVFLPEKECVLVNEVLAEIENSVRHEVEHVIQEEFPSLVNNVNYHKINFKLKSDPTHLCLYLVQPQEVSAHVRGYQAVSDNVLDWAEKVGCLLEGYVQGGHITREEKSSVFWCWKDWYDRNNYIVGQESEQCAK